jgi:hypothetical protein
MKKRKTQPSEPSRKRRPKPSECIVETEGVEYVINWDTFPITGFVFIKCIETDRVSTVIRAHAQRYGVSVALRVGIRNGYWGVGVWRTR